MNSTWTVVLFVEASRDLLIDGFHLLNSSVADGSLLESVIFFFRNGLLNGAFDVETFGRVCLISSNVDDAVDEMEIIDDE